MRVQKSKSFKEHFHGPKENLTTFYFHSLNLKNESNNLKCYCFISNNKQQNHLQNRKEAKLLKVY